MDEQIELLKNDFTGSNDYLSGVNDGMYHLKANIIQLDLKDEIITMADVERAFCVGYLNNSNFNVDDCSKELVNKFELFKNNYLRKVIP